MSEREGDRASGREPDDRGPGETLFAFVRHWARVSWANGPEASARGRMVLVTEAVHALAARGIDPTVNAVATEIGVDQSGASRMVKAAVDAGYLVMRPAESDRRRRQASITRAGRVLLDQAHDWQERVFDRLADGWSEGWRREFRLAMSELMQRSDEVDVRRA